MNHRPLPQISIALISASALGYEILLMRLFSIIQWHHFAYMVISLALLGYGISGTLLSIYQRPLLQRFNTVFIINIVLFGIAAITCYLIAQQLPLNAEEMLWDYWQLAWLACAYLLLAIPFFFASNCIALTIAAHNAKAGRIYAMDMLGAGLGSLCMIGLLFIVFPNQILKILALVGIVTAIIACVELKQKTKLVWMTLIFLVSVILWLPNNWTQLHPSQYKSLSQTLQIKGTGIIEQYSSPLGLLTVVESQQIPWRHAPGLSLHASIEPPEQLGVFTDGEGFTAITRYRGDSSQLAYLDYLTSSLPYHLGKIDKVLILGVGGGSDILQAHYHEAKQIDAVELNPQMVRLLTERYTEFTGNVFNSNNVRLYVGEARGFVNDTNQQFDLIQLSLFDSFGVSSAGLYALNESYLYTTQALQEYFNKLKENGYLALTHWVTLPPRDTLKIFVTAKESLQQTGVQNPERNLILIRGWQTSTLLIKNGDITIKEIELLKQFCKSRSFDLVYYPGIKPNEVNQYNILGQPLFYQATQALIGHQSEVYQNNYKFNLDPATDDRPYFFHFFKWELLPEIISLRHKGGAALIEWGYLILVITLLQAIIASLILIPLPLLLSKRFRMRSDNTQRWRVISYFSTIGIAFLFIEIAFMQKLILFLHHPLYATSVVLAAFLFFAGIGSAWAQRLCITRDRQKVLFLSVITIIVTGTIYLLMFSTIFQLLTTTSMVTKIVVMIILIAPLATCMGMPFPLAMMQLGKYAPMLIPWAWAVNGCTSVISAVLASLLAIELGYSGVIIIALGLYALIIFLFPQPPSPSN